jgi:hypothetical protein
MVLTYQLQRRVLKKTNEKEIVFPNEIEIEVCLEPTGQFGIGSNMGKTIVKGSQCTAVFDSNSGKSWIKSETFLNNIDATIEWTNLKLQLKGNVVFYKSKCDSSKDFYDLIIAVHYFVPILFNLEFAEPPVVKYTRGRIGDATFNWELRQRLCSFDVTDNENQEKRAIDSLQRITWVTDLPNRRLAASVYYFYVARRLVESGYSPFEFMAEAILSLNKVLEALFGEKRDEIRVELQKLGYSKNDVEEKFMPIMILRDNFDVGHVCLVMFSQKQLDILHRYLEISEENFRELLKRVIKNVEKGGYILQSEPDLSLKGKKLKKIEQWLPTMEKAIDPRRSKP